MTENVPAKRGPGRPRKITAHVARKIFLMAGYGMTDEQIAQVIGCARETIVRAKEDAQFCHTIARCKEEADLRVINSLYHRAIGYSHPEEKIFCHEGQIVRAETVKHYPPETEACKIWLFNRRRGEWKPPAYEHEKVDPTADKRAGTLVQIFQGVRQKELVRIRDGESQVDVLFGPDFVQKAKTDGNSTKRA